jgi:hypothetical protein
MQNADSQTNFVNAQCDSAPVNSFNGYSPLVDQASFDDLLLPINRAYNLCIERVTAK